MAALAALAACDRAPAEPQVTVEEAVVTLPVLPGRPGAAYFVLRTNNDPTRLARISSPQIGRIDLHETVTENGLSRMVPLRNSTFSPDEPLAFQAGGRHAMLFDIDPSVRVGGTVTLSFAFEPAPPVTVEAAVRGPGGGGHAGH